MSAIPIPDDVIVEVFTRARELGLLEPPQAEERVCRYPDGFNTFSPDAPRGGQQVFCSPACREHYHSELLKAKRWVRADAEARGETA